MATTAPEGTVQHPHSEYEVPPAAARAKPTNAQFDENGVEITVSNG